MAELFYDGNFSEIDLSDNPDFVRVARAFGIEAFRIDRPRPGHGGHRAAAGARRPMPRPCRHRPDENVWPLVAPGQSNSDMMEAL